jgi:hypothetical protein
MCNFLSALVLRNGDVLTAPELTDAHSELVEYFGLTDVSNSDCSHFAKVDFVPTGAPWEVDKYELRVDEDTQPVWWADVADRVVSDLRSRIQRMIISSGRRNLLLGGCWIVCGDAEIGDAKNGRIYSVFGSGRVGNVYDSGRVENVYDSGRVGNVSGSGSVENVYDSGRVGSVFGNGRVGSVFGNGRVGNVYDSGRVGNVYDSGRVGNVSGSGSVENVYGSGSVENVYGSGSVGNVSGSGRVGNVYGCGRVGSVSGCGRVGSVSGNGRIVNDMRTKTCTPAPL